MKQKILPLALATILGLGSVNVASAAGSTSPASGDKVRNIEMRYGGQKGAQNSYGGGINYSKNMGRLSVGVSLMGLNGGRTNSSDEVTGNPNSTYIGSGIYHVTQDTKSDSISRVNVANLNLTGKVDFGKPKGFSIVGSTGIAFIDQTVDKNIARSSYNVRNDETIDGSLRNISNSVSDDQTIGALRGDLGLRYTCKDGWNDGLNMTLGFTGYTHKDFKDGRYFVGCGKEF